MNAIKNCPVEMEDVDIAVKIFGPDIGTLKGKSVRRPPNPVRENLIEIPAEIKAEHKNLTLCIDIMFVNGLPLLTAIDRSIRFRSLVPLESRSKSDMYTALDKILRRYGQSGFRITSVHCDQEFRTLMGPVADELGVEMNYTTTDEHVPEAERNNRTIQERIRATYHHLPYAVIPKVMLQYLALTSAAQLNYFPAKGGVSPVFSPYTIMLGRAIDFHKQCMVPFGEYVQAVNNPQPTNTNAPRTIDAIYLMPTTNKQGGHYVMDLTTGRAITRPRVTPVPITPVVIRAVEEMARKQGIKSLKLKNRHGQPFTGDHLAGVGENDNEDIQDDDDSDTSSEDSDESDEDSSDSNDDSDDEDADDADLEDDDDSEVVDRNAIDDVLAEPRIPLGVPAHVDEDGDEIPALVRREPRRSTRVRRQPERLCAAAIKSKTKTRVPIKNPYEAYNRSLCERARQGETLFEDDDEYEKEKLHNLHATTTEDNTLEYEGEEAYVLARMITEINLSATLDSENFAQQFMLKKGLAKFGDKGRDAAAKEMEQLHKRSCFRPVNVSEMKPSERKKAQHGLMFITEKRDATVKARLVYNGKPTREWISKEEATSPTVSLESIMLTAAIDAKEGRDVMSADIPNAYIQAELPPTPEGNDRVIIKLQGMLVDLLEEMYPDYYTPFVVMENGVKTLYCEVTMGLYGMLIAGLNWFKKFSGDLIADGYEKNPYDPCVCNKMVTYENVTAQHTVKFHVDDLMAAVDVAEINTNFKAWLNAKYGGHGEVKVTRGRIHEYLGMTLDFTKKGEVAVDMS